MKTRSASSKQNQNIGRMLSSDNTNLEEKIISHTEKKQKNKKEKLISHAKKKNKKN